MMKRLFGYVRVSTTKQAEKGVSLTEQRAAIDTYATKQGFEIVGWYEEHVTAAKRGRPMFTAMLSALRQGKADGIVIHKIDRSARNLGDWADLGELIDAGFDIHLAHEPLDLRSRGGRLSADILAVVAADFIRNNRQEARKGFYGRLKQGIYPLGAPLGYLDNGKGGRLKTLDETRAPLVRWAFERYGSGEASLLNLLDELTAKGLRNRKGKQLSLTGLLSILKNPFYAGVIRLRKTGETFVGKHEPLIRMTTFEHVQDVLNGKKPRRSQVHDYVFRRLFACATCGRSLVGSVAKGRVYYRCQVPSCPTTCVREDALEAAILHTLHSVALPESEFAACQSEIELAIQNASSTREATLAQLHARLGIVEDRLQRLTDVYVDGRLERAAYEERRTALLFERQQLTDGLSNAEADQGRGLVLLSKCLELARDPENLYKLATAQDRRRIVEIVTSNRVVRGKDVGITVAKPFLILSYEQNATQCALEGVRPRTRSKISKALLAWIHDSPEEVTHLEKQLEELPVLALAA